MFENINYLIEHLKTISFLSKSYIFESFDTNELGEKYLIIPNVFIYKLNVYDYVPIHENPTKISIQFQLKFLLEDNTIGLKIIEDKDFFNKKYILVTGEYALICNVSSYSSECKIDDLKNKGEEWFLLKFYSIIDKKLDTNGEKFYFVGKKINSRFSLMEIE